MDIVRRVRSLRSDYELMNKQKADLYVQLVDTKKEELADLTPLIGTLASANNVNLLTATDDKSAIPVGCAKVTVSAKCTVSIALQGVLDIAKEVTKLNAKRQKLQQQVEKLKEVTAKADYEEKVPLGVRNNNTEKLQSMNTELKHLEEAIEVLSATA
jgi:valyl-tRNA synthetase